MDTKRTFNPTAFTVNPQPSEDTTWSIGGTLNATVKRTVLTPTDLIAILGKLPKNSHIINIKVSQFQHAEAQNGELYNSVNIEYHTDDTMQSSIPDGPVVRSNDKGPFGLGPNVLLCEHTQRTDSFAETVKKADNKISERNEILAHTLKSELSSFELDLLRASIVTDCPNELWHYISVSPNYRDLEPITDASMLNKLADMNWHIVNMKTLTFVDVAEVIADFAKYPGTVRLFAYSHYAPANLMVEYIVRKFEQFQVLAGSVGLPIKYKATDAFDLHLYFHGDYPNCILVDKDGVLDGRPSGQKTGDQI